MEPLTAMLHILLREDGRYAAIAIPPDDEGRRRLLRSLMNVRPPRPIDPAFWPLQDAYLQAESRRKGIVDAAALPTVPDDGRLALWQGDITRLAIDGIVNAANSALLGCFVPGHGCIDNAIHSAAGLQLRACCDEIMRRQGGPEPVGRAKITPGFNLPCRYVLHTVGPMIQGAVTPQDDAQLAACYRACLELAAREGLASLAFCCLSTGEFHFPRDRAAVIAIDTVRACLRTPSSLKKVVFNVYETADAALYRRLLGCPA